MNEVFLLCDLRELVEVAVDGVPARRPYLGAQPASGVRGSLKIPVGLPS